MSEFVTYIVIIGVTVWSHILELVGEQVPAYILLIFCLLCVLLVLWLCMYMTVCVFRFVLSLLRKGGRT